MTAPSGGLAVETPCHFPTRRGAAGHVAACQLCPASPTYWRGGPTTDVCRYDKPAEKTNEGADR